MVKQFKKIVFTSPQWGKFGLLKKICKKRPDLRLIVSSATLDAGKFKRFFETNKTSNAAKDTARVVAVEGRCFPVEAMFTKDPVRNYLQAAVVSLRCFSYII